LPLNAVTLIGLMAAALTTAANAPQVWKTWRTQEAADISLRMTSMLTAGLALWVAYGFMQGDIVIILANAIAAALGCHAHRPENQVWIGPDKDLNNWATSS
jgi:MtN3 and saliva related transmembrane protein